MSSQWLRSAELIVGDSSEAIDLSALRITFSIKQADIATPNTAAIRVYNLSDATAAKVKNEFDRVVLKAGYQDGGTGTIFDGTIIQKRLGRENATDTFLDIFAADGDAASNFAVINQSLAAGSTSADRVKAAAAAMAPFGVSLGFVGDLPAGQSIRGETLFGMAHSALRREADAAGLSYSIQNGTIQLVPLAGYLPGEAVVLNSATGMIGWPQQTTDGIEIRCLLNPSLAVGCKVQINNADILDAQKGLGIKDLNILPSKAADGVYRLYVLEHEGDTRGQAWYSTLTCLDVTGTSPTTLVQKGQA